MATTTHTLGPRTPALWGILGLTLGLGCASSPSASDETESETGEELEPLECPIGGCEPLELEGSLELLIGTTASDDPVLGCVLSSMQSSWFLHRIVIREQLDGEARETEIYVGGDGTAVVMQSSEAAGYTRIEDCELASPAFFAACAEDFDLACADLDRWFGACSSEGPACPSANSCEVPALCTDTPFVVGDFPEGDPSCAWAALRDADSIGGELAVLSEGAFSTDSYQLILDGETRSVGVLKFYSDDVGSGKVIQRCELETADFFQACLDTPTLDCNDAWRWILSCVEAPMPCP